MNHEVRSSLDMYKYLFIHFILFDRSLFIIMIYTIKIGNKSLTGQILAFDLQCVFASFTHFILHVYNSSLYFIHFN